MNQVKIETSKKAIAGSKSAFSEMIHERKADIYRIAYVYMRNESDSLDVVNETVYRAFISIKKLKFPEYFNTWLTRITINCSLNALKKKKKIMDNEIYGLADDVSDYYNAPSIEEQIVSEVDIMNSIEKLAFNEKTVVMLKYFQDLTLEQIAEILSWPIGTVKTRLNKALKLLRNELEFKN